MHVEAPTTVPQNRVIKVNCKYGKLEFDSNFLHQFPQFSDFFFFSPQTSHQRSLLFWINSSKKGSLQIHIFLKALLCFERIMICSDEGNLKHTRLISDRILQYSLKSKVLNRFHKLQCNEGKEMI